jgi:hypothetical protein
MGYYDNPPIIDFSKGYDYSQGIINASNAFVQGMNARADRKRQEEQQQELTIKRLQERKYEVDLAYNDKLSDWSGKQKNTNTEVDNQIYGIVQEAITTAADNRIRLLNETNPAKRQEYLQSIRDADALMTNTGQFAKVLAGQVATWRLNTPAIKVGEIGGNVINGKDETEILDNTAVVEVLGGMSKDYTDTNIKVERSGDSILLNVSGKRMKGGSGPGNKLMVDFNKTINSNTFNAADEDANNGFLLPVESDDTFIKQAKETIFDEKGKNIIPGFLAQTSFTVDLNSKNIDSQGRPTKGDKDIYQITNGKMLEETAIKAEIAKKAEITATGLIAASGSKPATLRTYINYTLKKGPTFYDKEFSILKPDAQKEALTKMLTDHAWGKMTREFETSTVNNKKVYWAPGFGESTKAKPSTTGGGGKQEEQQEPTYLAEYYDNLINGYKPQPGEQVNGAKAAYRTRSGLVSTLNDLSGKVDRFITREDLEKQYANSPYIVGNFDTKLTISEAIAKGKIKGTVKDFVKKIYGDSYIYTKEGEGTYKALKKYNIENATDRIRLALDYTANAGEKKQLQGKLKEAKLMDWVRKNPIKTGESQEAYAQRANKSI